MKLCIKNMVSLRCKMIVKEELEKLSLHPLSVELGEAEIKERLSSKKKKQLKAALLKFGFELLQDNKSILIEKIKNVIVETIHYSNELPKIKFSNYLSEKLNHDYTYLSNRFSEVKGTTIRHYIIANKIERVKEMLAYNQLSLKQISYKLHYSSEAHLSYQFKKITGLTPSLFKKMEHKRLIPLENL